MPVPILHVPSDAPDLIAGLQRIRTDLKVPGPFSAEALADADEAATRVLGRLEASAGRDRVDLRDLPFVTIDPPGSRDLDQALLIEAGPGGGHRIRYAIADVAAFVRPGGPLDLEVWQRGVTVYLPDERAPLHPDALGVAAASLLPGQDRPAVVWTIELDRDGHTVGDARLERAIVRSRAQLTYEGAQADIDAGRADGTVALLAVVGPQRQRIEAERGGVSLDLPSQRVTLEADGYHLEHERVVPAMGWNAQISLLTGMVAGAAMLDAGLGVLRTLPPPPEAVVAKVRAAAGALGVAWPEGATYPDVVRSLDSDVPAQAALLVMAARGLRGAGYLALSPDGPPPAERRAVEHAAVAAPYAHVTAPLRRLVDRFATEVCIGLFGGPPAPTEIVGRLGELPKTMAQTKGREGNAARAAVDLVEALLLATHLGEVFQATVVAEDDGRSNVLIPDPAIETVMDGDLPLGQVVPVRVVGTDALARTIDLDPVR